MNPLDEFKMPGVNGKALVNVLVWSLGLLLLVSADVGAVAVKQKGN